MKAAARTEKPVKRERGRARAAARLRSPHPGPDGPAVTVALGAAARMEGRGAEDLIERLRARQATVAVIGIGYVGLPLACEFARAGFTVHGIDVDASRVSALKQGRSHVRDVRDEVLAPLIERKAVLPGADFSVLADCQA